MTNYQLIALILSLCGINWGFQMRAKCLEKRLNIAEEMIHDLANQYMILLHVRREGKVIRLEADMAIKEREH